jgi:prepilin peptidase CpaA
MWATALQHHPSPPLQWGAVLGASLVAAVVDARSRRIPNLLTGPVFVAGVAQAAVVAGGAGIADSLLAALMLALPFVLLFAFAGGGAGDAKLAGALGAWLGLVQGALVLAAVAASGVVLAAAYAARHGRLGEVLATLGGSVRALLAPVFGAGSLRDLPGHLPDPARGLKMPYGIAIFAGALLGAAGKWIGTL